MGNYDIPAEYKQVAYVYSGGVGMKIFDGSESWRKSSAYDHTYCLALSGYKDNNLLCNILPGMNHWFDNFGIFLGYFAVNGIQVGLTDIVSNADEWKSMLSNLYANNTPMTLIYTLETPSHTATRIGLIKGSGPSPHTYIPCQRLSDGFYGLYCPENQTFTEKLGDAYFSGFSDVFPRKRLPEEYLEVEYLESTGSQWINTNMNAPAFCIVDYFGQSGLDNMKMEFGSSDTGNNIGTWKTSSSELKLTIRYFDVLQSGLTPKIESTNEFYHLQINKTGIIFNSTTIPFNKPASSVTQTNNKVAIFASSEQGLYKADVKIGFFSIRTELGEPLLTLIPALRKADSKPGMYDLVSGQFFVNQGTGDDFLYGAIVPYPKEIENNGKGVACIKAPILPGEYQQVEYLESHGTEWIDTGIKENETTQLYLDIYTLSNASGFFFNNSTTQIGINDSRYGTTNVNKRYQLQDVFIGGRWEFKNLTNGTVYSQNSGIKGINLALFTLYDAQQFITNGCRLNYCYFKNNNTLVRDFIPCYRKSDNKPGLFDLCNSRKNLFDKSSVVKGYYISAEGILMGDSGMCYSSLIKCQPNTTYSFSGVKTMDGYYKRIHCYDENGNWLQQLGYTLGGGVDETYTLTVTTLANAAYIRVSVPYNDTQVQLEKGSVSTTYEPYPFYVNQGTGEFSVGDDIPMYGRWNQLIPNGDVERFSNVGTENYYLVYGKNTNRIPKGHKCFISADLKSNGIESGIMYLTVAQGGNTYGNAVVVYVSDIADSYKTFTGITVSLNDSNYGLTIIPRSVVEGDNRKFAAKNAMLIDLTEIFGPGNEPATVEEFEAWCQERNIDLDTYQPYDPGSIRVFKDYPDRQTVWRVAEEPGYEYVKDSTGEFLQDSDGKYLTTEEDLFVDSTGAYLIDTNGDYLRNPRWNEEN